MSSTPPTWGRKVCSSPRTLPTGTVVSCRKCDACMRRRQAHWMRRASQEFELAPRSWWVTLTLRDAALSGASYETAVKPFVKSVQDAFPELVS